jgi:phage tail-like protein
MATTRADPATSFRFSVNIQGIGVALFSECSGLEFEQEIEPFKEGGLNSRVHQLPGRFKFTNLTLKRGIATDGTALWTWVMNTVKGTIAPYPVTVSLLAQDGTTVRVWNFTGAYPIKWSASNLSADQNAIAIETLILAHQGMDFAQ